MYNKLEIIVWDVNHGNATSVRLPNNKIIMLDCGSNPLTDFSPIIATKRHWGTDRLNYLVISHPHMDHIRDILNLNHNEPEILSRPKNIEHSKLRRDKFGTDRGIIEKYIELDRKYTSPFSMKSDTGSWSGNVDIQNFRLNQGSEDLNDYSSVTFLTYGAFCFAYAGDLTTQGWEDLIEQEGSRFTNMLKKVNFFQVAHHGRKEGYNPTIFDYMNPYLAIVSDKKTQDTSVTSRYSEKCRGWNVYDENSAEYMKNRKVITTRYDGRIKLNITIRANTEVGVSTMIPTHRIALS